MVKSLSNYYDLSRLREQAALSNSPITYCLTYESNTHRIAGIWAFQWLIDFVNNVDFVSFHPYALRLIKDNLPKWRNPLANFDDYQLFLHGVTLDPQRLDLLIIQAIQENRVLYFDKNQTPPDWILHYE
jgi:hypothetical protein